MLPDIAIGALVEALHHTDRNPSPSRAAVSRIVASASLLPSRWTPFARCVVARESHGNPKARNPHSSAQGKYQFLDHSWRDGLAHMVRARLVERGMPKAQAKSIRITLQSTPIAAWPERMQDIGFAAVIAAGGWRHWTGGHGCNALVPAGAR